MVTMEMCDSVIDISALPDIAKIEILDFYQFLFNKYGGNLVSQETKSKEPRYSKFLSNPIKIKNFHFYSRDELYA
jgi:hypothetical protein